MRALSSASNIVRVHSTPAPPCCTAPRPRTPRSRVAIGIFRNERLPHSATHAVRMASVEIEPSRAADFVDYALKKFARLGLLLADTRRRNEGNKRKTPEPLPAPGLTGHRARRAGTPSGHSSRAPLGGDKGPEAGQEEEPRRGEGHGTGESGQPEAARVAESRVHGNPALASLVSVRSSEVRGPGDQAVFPRAGDEVREESPLRWRSRAP